jgi:hypothetical protein
MKRTSYPRAVSRSLKVAALTAIAMAVAIYGALMHGRTIRATRALHVLPSTARAVLRIDSRMLSRSTAARALLEGFVPASELSEIALRCGLDPVADLAEATLWVRGSEREPLQSFGLMLTGARVDAAQIADCYERLVDARGGSVTRIDAPTGPLLASNDRGSAIALVDDRTVVTGAIRTVAEAMAARQGLLPTLSQRPAIAALWPTVSAGSAIAAALDLPSHWQTALERITRFDKAASTLRGIDAMGLAARPAAPPVAEVHLHAVSVELAAETAARIRAAAANPPNAIEPPWDELLRSALVSLDGRNIIVRVDLSTLLAPR